MDDIIEKLGLSNAITFDELPHCKICNLDKDKILIICFIDELQDIEKTVNRLPSLRKSMMDQINNRNNIEVVQNKKIPMSKFLWDMYVVALHKINENDNKFKASEIAKYERDRFIARKIIIQFDQLEELQEKFNQYVFPERVLNAFPTIDIEEDDAAINFEEIKKLIGNIESVIEED